VRRVTLTLGFLVLLAVAAPASHGASFGNGAVRCAWPVESTPTKANILYPDANATYWTTPFVATRGLRMTLRGTFPEARYFSIQAYSSDAQLYTVNGVESSITDYEIIPNRRHGNPWRSTKTRTNGTYTVRLIPRPRPKLRNALPIAPTSATTPLVRGLPKRTGFVMIRVYLPEGNDPSTVALPTITLTSPGRKARTLKPCARPQATAKGKSPIRSTVMKRAMGNLLGGTGSFSSKVCTTDCPPSLSFFKAGASSTPFPNSASGYAAALYQPADGYVTIVRATMPTSASAAGNAPAPWPASGIDLRYWSFCNYVYSPPFPVVTDDGEMGCVADEDMPLVGGVATVVISSAADRPASTQSPGATVGWLPTQTGSTARELVAIRNMLAAPGFDQSVMEASTSNDPAAAQAAMGGYYPRATQCTVATFTSGGADACFANPSSPS
jgi:hypothetical protein